MAVQGFSDDVLICFPNRISDQYSPSRRIHSIVWLNLTASALFSNERLIIKLGLQTDLRVSWTIEMVMDYAYSILAASLTCLIGSSQVAWLLTHVIVSSRDWVEHWQCARYQHICFQFYWLLGYTGNAQLQWHFQTMHWIWLK